MFVSGGACEESGSRRKCGVGGVKIETEVKLLERILARDNADPFVLLSCEHSQRCAFLQMSSYMTNGKYLLLVLGQRRVKVVTALVDLAVVVEVPAIAVLVTFEIQVADKLRRNHPLRW